jgi:hypothetical protein
MNNMKNNEAERKLLNLSFCNIGCKSTTTTTQLECRFLSVCFMRAICMRARETERENKLLPYSGE